MKLVNGQMQFELPADLRAKLLQFRRKVWAVKTAEAVFTTGTVMALSYLTVFVLDRLGETPAWLRTATLLVALAALLIYLPAKLYRWIWQTRGLTALARLLAQDQPRVGDRLLGVIELVQHHDNNASPRLCEAAIQQVADDTRPIDFLRSVPKPRHKQKGVLAGLFAVLTVAALCIPGAGVNALARWGAPLASITRYTFAQLADLQDRIVVPIGEPFTVTARLKDSTVWKPMSGTARYGRQDRIGSELTDEAYSFEIPSQTEPAKVKLAVGDARLNSLVEPKSRPELTALTAHIQLPDYLGYPPLQRDARSGSVTIVKGSQASFEATASRDLAEATVDDQTDGIVLTGATIKLPPMEVSELARHELRWTDVDNLSARTPFQIRIRAVEDQAPTVQCSQMPAEKVLLDEDTLSFEVLAGDDFGVKEIGVEWTEVEDTLRNPNPQQGEYLLAAGDQLKSSLTVQGAFSPKKLGIKPQVIHLKVYAEDYLPDRERSYSPVYRIYVLDRQQHMIWVTEQLQDWERQALEVRDQEQRLLETNQELQTLSPEELDNEATRQKIARQAAAERANAQRLTGLTMSGEQLISEALRNDEFNVASLEKWAQMLNALKGLSSKNMPSVANLLAEAANAAKASEGSPPSAPSISDKVRAANRDPDEKDEEEKSDEGSSPSGSAPLGLPETTIAGPPSKGGGSCPAGQKMDEAVEEQQKLLEEFNKVMGELAELMADLQGSTFVKRLKAAADNELKIASTLHGSLPTAFGEVAPALPKLQTQELRGLQTLQVDTSTDVRLIQEDLVAYFERTQRSNYKTVADEMSETQVVSNFKEMSIDVARNMSGETIAQAEYWSDQLDRWAEIIVGPG
ncbi:MAG: hypothetical protein KDA87_18605 [Planctomycetales bacterium]|nr:hypothetical protein [Planctomycetales bacterium]